MLAVDELHVGCLTDHFLKISKLLDKACRFGDLLLPSRRAGDVSYFTMDILRFGQLWLHVFVTFPCLVYMFGTPTSSSRGKVLADDLTLDQLTYLRRLRLATFYPVKPLAERVFGTTPVVNYGMSTL